MGAVEAPRRAGHNRRPAVLAWAATSALILFTLAAMASIGMFLLVPTGLVTWRTARRFGATGAALGLPSGFVITLVVLGILGS